MDESFERFFRSALPEALRVGRRILTSEADAEDAAAEAFARAHAAWRRVGALDHRRAWVLRVTANVAIDMARKRSRRTPITLDRIEDHSDAAVLQIALTAALSALPKRQREIVVLRYLQGYSEADTARALGISVGTVKKAAHRATRSLREHLGSDRRPFELNEGITDAAH